MNIILFFAIIFQLGNCFCMNSPVTPNAGPCSSPQIKSYGSSDSKKRMSSTKEEKEEEEYKESPLSLLQESPGDIGDDTPMSDLPTEVINAQGITPLHTSSSGFGLPLNLTSLPQNYLKKLRPQPPYFRSNQNQPSSSNSPFCVSSLVLNSKTGQSNRSGMPTKGLQYSHGDSSESGTDNDPIMDALVSINSEDGGMVRPIIFYPQFSKGIHQGKTIEHIEKLDIKLNSIEENPISIGGGHFLPDGQEEIISIGAPHFLQTPILNFSATLNKGNNQIENARGFKIDFWTITATDQTRMDVENEIKNELENDFNIHKDASDDCLKNIGYFFTQSWNYVKKLKKLQIKITKKTAKKKALTPEEKSMNKIHWQTLLVQRNCQGEDKRKKLSSNIKLLKKFITDESKLTKSEKNTVIKNLCVKREGKGNQINLTAQEALDGLLECQHFLKCYQQAENDNKIAGLEKEDIIAHALLCILIGKEPSLNDILESRQEKKDKLTDLFKKDIIKKLLFYLNNLIIPHYKTRTR